MNEVTSGPHRSPAWSRIAIAELLDVVRCPVCAAGIVAARRCPTCGADFSGAIGDELWRASRRAVDALHARQAVLERVPLVAGPAPAAAPASTQATPASPAPDAADAPWPARPT